MDRREFYLDQQEGLRMAFSYMQSRMWTALPGSVVAYHPAQMTVDVQPAINGTVLQQDGTFVSIQMPVLLDCPVIWQRGGGVTFTFPIAVGDECLVVLSARCIDQWWSNGFQPPTTGQFGADGKPVNVQNDPPKIRMHNLSDGFALIGPKSLPKVFTPDTTSAVLRTDDGEAFLSLNPTTHAFNMTAPGGITLNGVTIDSSGNMDSPGNVTADGNVQADGTVTGTTEVVAKSGGAAVHLSTHTHPTAPSGPVSAPTPGS